MSYIFSFAVLIVVLFGNVLYIFQDVWFFDRQFVQLWSYERQSSVMDEAKILMEYWRNDDVLVYSDVYTHAEKEHLYDVKKILNLVRYLLLATCFWLLALGGWMFWKWLLLSPGFFVSLRMTIVWFVFLCFVLWLSAWLWWDVLFDVFHRLLFVDNWLFPADSFLIQSYPWQFFRNAMVVIALRSIVMLLATGFLLLAFGWMIRK
jgi:hypothetical protein